MKRLPIGLMVAGVLLAAGGGIGLATKGGGATPVAGGSPSGTSSPSAPASASPSPSPSPAAETVQEFLPDFQKAIRSGDQFFLFARLHPAVLDLYGRDQCRTHMSTFRDPTLRFTIVSVTGPAEYDYNPDGRNIPVQDAFTVTVRRTSQGTTTRQDTHFALVDGQLRWFTDCGTPTA